jgi:hypothetical protein
MCHTTGYPCDRLRVRQIQLGHLNHADDGGIMMSYPAYPDAMIYPDLPSGSPVEDIYRADPGSVSMVSPMISKNRGNAMHKRNVFHSSARLFCLCS